MPDTATDRALPAAPQPHATATVPGHAVAEGPLALGAGSATHPTAPARRRMSRGGPAPASVVSISTALAVLAALTLGFVGELTGLGALRHHRDQVTAYADFRADLANGVAPVGPTDADGVLLTEGSPVALLRIPDLGISEVVAEGTSSGVTMSGPGHRRDTVLPGQTGVSVVVGRRASFGGPFASLGNLAVGSTVSVTTGQGDARFTVTGVRRAGDAGPTAIKAGGSRLVLVTADGPAYSPTGVLYVDADLVGEPQLAPPAAWAAASLPAADQLMAGDTRALVPLVLWSELLLLLVLALTWAVLRWGRWQTWVVGVPAVAVLGLAVIDQVARLLPNLL